VLQETPGKNLNVTLDCNLSGFSLYATSLDTCSADEQQQAEEGLLFLVSQDATMLIRKPGQLNMAGSDVIYQSSGEHEHSDRAGM
jgi:hypothetical protein